jgi:hypothetical protein
LTCRHRWRKILPMVMLSTIGLSVNRKR